MKETFDITKLPSQEQTKLVALVDCLSDLLDMAKDKISKKEGNGSVEEGMNLPGFEQIELEVKEARSMIEGVVVDPELYLIHSREIRKALTRVSGLNATVQEQAKEISGNSLSEGEAVDKVKDLAQKHEQNVFTSLTENANAMVSKFADQALGFATALYTLGTPEGWSELSGAALAAKAMENSTAAHRSTGKAHNKLEKAVTKIEHKQPLRSSSFEWDGGDVRASPVPFNAIPPISPTMSRSNSFR